MTRFHRELIRCPYCLNEEDIPVWDRIDAQTDPDLKERLLRKRLQVFDCRNCGRKHLLARPLLYQDEAAGLMVWFDPRLDPQPDPQLRTDSVKKMGLDAPSGWHLRLTTHTNQLIEKIHLFDHHLDDRLMEITKQAILAWQQEDIKVLELRFLSAVSDRMVFLALGEDRQWYQLPVDPALYQHLEQQLYGQLPEDTGWLVVDEAMAAPYRKLFE